MPDSAPTDALLRRFFREAADDAEGTIHRIRVAILLLVQLRLLAIALPEFLSGAAKHWITTGVILGGALGSTALVRAIRRVQHKEPLQVASAVLDATLAFLVVLPGVLWPRPAYAGVLAAPDFGIWVLVATAGGLRMSRGAAVAGPLAACAGIVGLVTIDHALNAAVLRYGPPEMVLAGVLMVGATLLARGLYFWIGALVRRASREAGSAERVRARLGAYLSEEVAEFALRAPEAALGGEARDVAVLFSDLRGFTRTGEQLGPDELIQQLNEYLEAMVQAIHENGGVVDKYMGDAILAVFGIPERRGDEASRAVRTALRMQELLAAYNQRRSARGLVPLAHGVGVHYGPVVAGHVGTRSRLQYTVIGDTVNVASRLQTATKEVGATILLSDALLARARSEGADLPPLRTLEPLTLRGRNGQIGVHTFAFPM